jgi:DNA polymerase
VVDFETHYTKTYSLGKMTTEEYVRSPDFEVIGVSVQVGSDEPVWFSGTRKETKEFLEGFDFGSNLALAHNAMFDAAILSWHFDIHPKGWLDTLSMGRALHGTEVGGSLAVLAKHYELGVKGDEVLNALGKRRADFTPEELARYGEYCKNDVALTWGLFAAMSETFPKVELRLIDLTIRMFSEPVLQLDNKLLTNHLEEIKTVKEALIGSLDKGMLMSNPQLAEWLRNHGVEPPMKISPTTGKE